MTNSVERLLTETGDIANVNLQQNVTGERDYVAQWTVPKEYSQLVLATSIHETKFIPRTKESGLTVQDDNGDLYVSVSGDLNPIAGEEALEDQDFPVAYVHEGGEVGITRVDYAQDRIYLDGNDTTAGNTADAFYVITDGSVYLRVKDVFENVGDVLDRFGMPVRVFSELEQNSRSNRPHLSGRATLSSSETLELLLESDQQIVWQDPDYPSDYVSQISQRVELE